MKSNDTGMETAADKALKRFADMMVAKIKQVRDDWHKPWLSVNPGLPCNLEGRNYNGMNRLMLSLYGDAMGYRLPVYTTFMSALSSGVSVLKGEKCFPVVYWNFTVKDRDGNRIPFETYRQLAEEQRAEYSVRSFLKVFRVFNVEQTDMREKCPDKWEALESRFSMPVSDGGKGMYSNPALDSLLRSQEWICPIQVRAGDSAYYRHAPDARIVVPLKRQFECGESFYSTLLHEMAHSTGEAGFLGREKGVLFGDAGYAREELVAELTAAVCGRSLGIACHPRNENAMYLKSWLSALEEDPKFIYSLLSDVGKASDMIMERAPLVEAGMEGRTSRMTAMLEKADIDPSSLEKKELESLSEGRAVMLPDGGVLLRVKGPDGYSLRVSGKSAGKAEAAVMEIQ